MSLHNLLTSRVSVLSGLPSCSILVQKFQGFSLEALGQRICLLEEYASDFFVSLHSIFIFYQGILVLKCLLQWLFRKIKGVYHV